MKKTLSIHLGRQLFVIEEDAYDRLQQYLQRLEHSLKAETGIGEIMEDIEMRFAELIHSYLGENRKVVGLADVEKGIASLGEPEEISEEPAQSEEKQQKEERTDRTERRFYRDPEHGMLGGVCSGLAAYMGMDPVIVRVIFFLLCFTGIGVPAYLLLWIILPNAITPSDRLRMHGKPVTVDTLKEEFVKATDRIKDDTLRARDKFRSNSDQIVDRTKHAIRTLFKIGGFGLVIVSTLWLLFFSLAASGMIDLVPATGDSDYISVHDFLDILIPVKETAFLMWSAILLIGFSSPILGILVGTRMITEKYKRFFRTGILILSIILGAGFVLGLISGLQTGRDFAVYSEVEQQHLTANVAELNLEELPQYSGERRIIASGGVDFIAIKKGIIHQEGIWLTYRTSKDSLYHIYQVVSAHGINRTIALSRSGRIRHTLQLNGSKLLISPHYSFPSKDGLRNQEVEVIIEVPSTKKLKINGITINRPETEFKDIFRSNELGETWEE